MAYPNDGDPLQLQIQEAIRARMAAIAPPNYKRTVRGASVWDGVAPLTTQDTPWIFVVPGTDAYDQFVQSNDMEGYVQSFDLLCLDRFTVGTDEWKKDIVWLATDVRHAIQQDIQWGGLALRSEAQLTDHYDADVSNGLAQTVVRLRVTYRHRIDNPSLAI